jgi:hypothetical protein
VQLPDTWSGRETPDATPAQEEVDRFFLGNAEISDTRI